MGPNISRQTEMNDVTTSVASSNVWPSVNTFNIVQSRQPWGDSWTSSSHCRTVFLTTPSLCSLVWYVGTSWTTLWFWICFIAPGGTCNILLIGVNNLQESPRTKTGDWRKAVSIFWTQDAILCSCRVAWQGGYTPKLTGAGLTHRTGP